MGLPALKERFESLSAATQAPARDVTRVAEIISFGMGDMIRSGNSLAQSLMQTRTNLLVSLPELRGMFDKLEHDEIKTADLADCAVLRALMIRFLRNVSRPYFETVNGASSVSIADRMSNFQGKTSGDGRTVRRLAKRVREAAEDCEVVRIRFADAMTIALERFDALIAAHFDREDFHKAYVQALAAASVKRFPEVNAYLAR